MIFCAPRAEGGRGTFGDHQVGPPQPGSIVYIPNKTKDGRPETVRAPLNDTAKAILEKYKECEDDRLLTRQEVKRLCNVYDAAFRRKNNCTIYSDNAGVRWWFKYRDEPAFELPPTIIDKYHNNVLIIHNVMKYWIEHRG